MSSISEWTGLIVRDRQQGRQQVTVPTATGTATPTSPTGSPRTPLPRTSLKIRSAARVLAAASPGLAPLFPFTSSVAPAPAPSIPS